MVPRRGQGESINFMAYPVRILPCFFAIAVTAFAAAIAPVFAQGAFPKARQDKSDAITLVPHRAVYDLTLAEARGKRPIASVRGRILYDFSGNSCEGYALQFRQVSEIDSGEGRLVVSDLRAATWEDGAAKSFRFNSQNFFNDKLVDSVDGHADRRKAETRVNLKKPATKAFNLDGNLIFPTDHMRRIIAAARAGQTFIDLPVYDGSETGEKVYSTFTVIGPAVDPGKHKLDDATAKQNALAGLKRWPVTISYFEKSGKSGGGEQIPAYSITFELFENGISRALVLDYNDFVLKGEMKQIEIKPQNPCK